MTVFDPKRINILVEAHCLLPRRYALGVHLSVNGPSSERCKLGVAQVSINFDPGRCARLKQQEGIAEIKSRVRWTLIGQEDAPCSGPQLDHSQSFRGRPDRTQFANQPNRDQVLRPAMDPAGLGAALTIIW